MKMNPPPQRLPQKYNSDKDVRDYEQRQKEVIRLLFENQSGSKGGNFPTDSDEFSRRYSLMIGC